jgi:Tol biopolymer transport system component
VIAYNPSFAPNGKRIVFVGQGCHSELKCKRKIRSMDLHGRNRRVITRTCAVCRRLASIHRYLDRSDGETGAVG